MSRHDHSPDPFRNVQRDYVWLDLRCLRVSPEAAGTLNSLPMLPVPLDGRQICLLYVLQKRHLVSRYSRSSRGTKGMSAFSQKICDRLGTPLLVLLNNSGAVLFQPFMRARRIFPRHGLPKDKARDQQEQSLYDTARQLSRTISSKHDLYDEILKSLGRA